MSHRVSRVLAVLFLFALTTALLAACGKQEQPAETDTRGNATDRSTNGTTGTGVPASPANDTRAAATQLDTAGGATATGGAATTTGTGTMAVTGTEVIHGQQTVTTSTMQGPAGTATAAVETPTDTSATIKTTTGTSTQTKKH